MSDISDYELYHYGVPGMKWGVRKSGYRSDNRTARRMRRELAAGKKAMRGAGRAADAAVKNYVRSTDAYYKEATRFRLSKRRQQRLVTEASNRMAASKKELAKRDLDMQKITRMYDKNAAEYKKHVDAMISKYGSEKVKNISTKSVKMGKNYCQDVVKTGVTLANLPMIGSRYARDYLRVADSRDTRKRITRDNYEVGY